MTSQSLMHKDRIHFDGQLLDVRYHDYGDDIVLDTVKKAGTRKNYDYAGKSEQLKDKLSGRF